MQTLGLRPCVGTVRTRFFLVRLDANQSAGFSCINSSMFSERQCIEHSIMNKLANEGWSTFSVATNLIYALACVVTGVSTFGIPLSADVFRLRNGLRKLRSNVSCLEEGVKAEFTIVKADVQSIKADVTTVNADVLAVNDKLI
ncbi:hypothetical protein GPALN_003115 [Globodera pallida]|uniref:Col_cuticle_N domain-containing protein n=1 Tax=Globodera pallida TaxID=36090 RepID=A0A183CFC9_GLOPA|nr:hypothetical protein GPALN_003115 [Globodera pallida]